MVGPCQWAESGDGLRKYGCCVMPERIQLLRRGRIVGQERDGGAEGGAAGGRARVERPAPSGTDSATSGTSSMPCASSSEPPPISNSRMHPDDQPNQRRTARNVSLAWSVPESTRSS